MDHEDYRIELICSLLQMVIENSDNLTEQVLQSALFHFNSLIGQYEREIALLESELDQAKGRAV